MRLLDVFEIDHDAFCTVLEYCEGSDLDFVLKQNKLLSERVCVATVLQIGCAPIIVITVRWETWYLFGPRTLRVVEMVFVS